MTDEWIDGYGYPPPHLRKRANEPTVQVPVSLLRRIERALTPYAGRGGRAEALIDVTALLSQPTPSAEPERTYTTADVQEAFERGCVRGEQDANERNWSRRQYEKMQASLPHAAPPSIADMAPGTTFTEASDGWPRTAWTVGERHDGTKYVKRQSDGWVLDPNYIDPSTIRDVTPPT